MLPDDLKMKAQKRADREGVSLGGFIRLCLKRHLDNALEDKLADDPFVDDNAVSDVDVPLDTSENHDAYLYGDGTEG